MINDISSKEVKSFRDEHGMDTPSRPSRIETSQTKPKQQPKVKKHKYVLERDMQNKQSTIKRTFIAHEQLLPTSTRIDEGNDFTFLNTDDPDTQLASDGIGLVVKNSQMMSGIYFTSEDAMQFNTHVYNFTRSRVYVSDDKCIPFPVDSLVLRAAQRNVEAVIIRQTYVIPRLFLEDSSEELFKGFMDKVLTGNVITVYDDRFSSPKAIDLKTAIYATNMSGLLHGEQADLVGSLCESSRLDNFLNMDTSVQAVLMRRLRQNINLESHIKRQSFKIHVDYLISEMDLLNHSVYLHRPSNLMLVSERTLRDEMKLTDIIHPMSQVAKMMAIRALHHDAILEAATRTQTTQGLSEEHKQGIMFTGVLVYWDVDTDLYYNVRGSVYKFKTVKPDPNDKPAVHFYNNARMVIRGEAKGVWSKETQQGHHIEYIKTLEDLEKFGFYTSRNAAEKHSAAAELSHDVNMSKLHNDAETHQYRRSEENTDHANKMALKEQERLLNESKARVKELELEVLRMKQQTEQDKAKHEKELLPRKQFGDSISEQIKFWGIVITAVSAVIKVYSDFKKDKK